MCGRYTLRTRPDVLQAQFGVPSGPELLPRYNIAPTQPVAAVRLAGANDPRELVLLRWGLIPSWAADSAIGNRLIPSWAADSAIGNRLINARADTVADKPSFRSAFRTRRCLVLADGFFEWRSSQGKKQPYYFRLRDERPFAFAGLWERWTRGDAPIESCTILTTDANAVVGPVHDRMPVILPPETHDFWLDPAVKDVGRLQTLLRPYRADEMIANPVDVRVNSPRHDDVGCIQSLA